MSKVEITSKERDTILAALRFYQHVILCERAPTVDQLQMVDEIATNVGRHRRQTARAVDKICEKINQ